MMDPREPSEPITTPDPVGPAYTLEPDYEAPYTTGMSFGRFMADLVRKPAHWFRENVVEPNRGPKYYYYHKKFKRALPIDECYFDDLACMYEADLEMRRTNMVDFATLNLLRLRRDNCWFWNSTRKGGPMHAAAHEHCKELENAVEREAENYHIKYGEFHYSATITEVYNRQKIRMIAERRRDEKLKQQESENQ